MNEYFLRMSMEDLELVLANEIENALESEATK